MIPDLGARRLDDLTTGDFQRLVARLRRVGFDASTVRNAMMPARVIIRRAVQLERVTVNPTLGLAFPPARGRRDRIAPPREASLLIAATPVSDRARRRPRAGSYGGNAVRIAREVWKALALDPVTMHEARHTYASLMIAAGVAPKELKAGI